MSMVLTRPPLESIGMNGAGTQKRRSARLSHEDVGENEPPSKKPKTNGTGTTTSVSTKDQDGGSKVASKRKQKVYEDKDDDFPFRRKKATKESAAVKPADAADAPVAKPAPPSPRKEAPLAPVVEDPAPKTTQKKTRRRFPTTPERDVAEKTIRRSKRISNDGPATESQIPPQGQADTPSHANEKHSPSPDGKAQPVTVEKKREQRDRGLEDGKIMRIALPFADTPIIRRNREMRKASAEGNRRSSAGMRGRRASSLIDEGRGHAVSSGTESSIVSSEACNNFHEVSLKPNSEPGIGPHVNEICHNQGTITDSGALHIALPHAEVPSSEFYKHVSADLTEPRRMRCLLGWCGTRALPAKPEPPSQTSASASLEFAACQAARIIQEEISSDLVTKGSLSDWFSRDETVAPLIPLRKKPNPRNIANAAKVEQLSRELEKLEKEKAEWDEVVKSAAPPSPASERRHIEAGMASPLHPDLLDSPQRAIYEQLDAQLDGFSSDPHGIQQRLQGISENLEFAVDQFAHGVHALKTARDTAERVADKSLADAASALDERERQRAASGHVPNQMAALRGLARILNSKYP